MAAVTRLGLYGGPRSLYGSFEGKEEQVIVEEEIVIKGGSGLTEKQWKIEEAKQIRALQRRYRQIALDDDEILSLIL